MLINAANPGEVRIAVLAGSALESYKVDVAERASRGNIYRGIIASIQPSLNAAFIDYGAERHGFLAIQDVVPDAYYRRAHGGHPASTRCSRRASRSSSRSRRTPMGTEGRRPHHQPLASPAATSC